MVTHTEKQYVLGRKEKTIGSTLQLGRYYALDGSLGASVYLDADRPHIILICGKRGYGKSYTIGTIIEELTRLDTQTKNNIGVLVFDTLGIFWTMRYPNKKEKETLKQWNLDSTGFNIRLIVPKNALDDYISKGIDAQQLSLRTADLTAYHWCQLFNVKPTEPLGVLFTRAILHLQTSVPLFSLTEVRTFIQNDKQSDPVIKAAAENMVMMADSWGIFEKDGMKATDLVNRGTVTVLDLSHLPHPQLKVIVAALIGEQIFLERVRERKIHEQKKIGFNVEEKGLPMVWCAIDEAQLFLPNDAEVLSKEVFINEWMRQGRQPGLTLVLATQRPSSLDNEVLSHSDIIICHRLTAQDDIDALSRIRPVYMHGDIAESIKKIGEEKGVAFIVDDTSESSQLVKIRPRLSWHGGGEAHAREPEKTTT